LIVKEPATLHPRADGGKSAPASHFPSDFHSLHLRSTQCKHPKIRTHAERKRPDNLPSHHIGVNRARAARERVAISLRASVSLCDPILTAERRRGTQRKRITTPTAPKQTIHLPNNRTRSIRAPRMKNHVVKTSFHPFFICYFCRQRNASIPKSERITNENSLTTFRAITAHTPHRLLGSENICTADKREKNCKHR